MVSLMRSCAQIFARTYCARGVAAALFAAVFVMAGLVLPSVAAAQSLYGREVRVQIGGAISPEVRVAGPGVEYPDLYFDGAVSLDITETGIVIRNESNAPWSVPQGVGVSNTYNGPIVTFTGYAIPSTITLAPGSAPHAAPPVIQRSGTFFNIKGVVYAPGDTITYNFDGSATLPAPAITSLSSVEGPETGGNSIQVTGTGFTSGTTVRFGANAATSVTFQSSTSITVTTPPGTGKVDVTATSASGTSAAAGTANDYTYVAVPETPEFPTGPGGIGRFFNTATPTFAGTVGSHADVMILIDGNEVGTATLTGGGNFTFTTAALSEGRHTLAAYAFNVAGQSATIDPIRFSVDTVAPDAPVITNPVSGQVLRNVTLVQGTAESGSEVFVYLNGGGDPSAAAGALGTQVQSNLLGTALADDNGDWTLELEGQNARAQQGIPSVGETPASLYAVSVDGFGNASIASATVEFKTDEVPPVEPTVTGPTEGSVVNSAFPTFTGTGEPGSRVTVMVDSTPFGSGIVDSLGNWSVTGGNVGIQNGAQNTVSSGGGLTAGPHSFVVISEDPAGNQSTSAPISFNVVLLVVTPTTLSDGAVASAYSATISATGCVGPCTFAVTAGALPAGITLSSAGELSGTPTAGGSFDFTVTATDAGASGITAEQAYTLVIAAPTVTSASTLAAGRRGFAYSQTLVGSGGTGPYTFALGRRALQSGPLPAGITLSSAGVVSGTPTEIGSFFIKVVVTDSSTGSGPYFSEVSLILVVNAAAITVTPATLPSVMAGVSYDQPLSASGGSGAYTYTVTAGALPSGITLSTAGRLSGSSYQVGDANFTVTATDAFGNSGSVPLRLTILTRPDPSQDPDVRGLDAAQAEAARRLTGAQFDNFSQRLEQLRSGGGTSAMTNGLNLNSGVMDLGRQADQRTQLGGGRMFDRQTQVDPDRAELNSMLWSSASADGLNPAGSMTGGSPLGYGSGAGSVSGGQPSMNAAPTQSDGASSNGLRFWTGGAVTIGERDADGGQAGFSVRSTGISMGVDFAVNPNFDLGFGGGFGEESADIGSADSEVDSKQFSGVVYGSLRPQSGVFIDAMLGYGSLEFDMQRRVTADGSLVMGERDGTAMFGSIGLGYDRPVSIGRMSAYGRIESLDATLDAYTETGSALWALSYAERDVESLQGVLGARYVWSHEERDSTWTPSFRFEYRHEFADGGVQSLQYADWLTGPTYQIQSTGWDRSEINLGLGLNVTTAHGWKVNTDLGARLSTNQTAGTLRLMLSKKF